MKILVMTPAPLEYLSMKQTLKELEELIQQNYASQGTQIVCSCPEDLIGGGGIQLKQMKARALCGFSHYLLGPAIIKKALEAQENGFDAVIQDNAYDPGIEAARFVVRIPVLGVGKASLHLASFLADRIGILVPFDSHIPYAFRLIRSYGLSDFIADIVAVNPSAGSDENQVLQYFETAGKKCIQAGAQIIIPLCGLFIPLTISARAFSERIGIQVVDTFAVGVGFAEFMVRFGLTHSEKSYPSLVEIMSSEISSSHPKGIK